MCSLISSVFLEELSHFCFTSQPFAWLQLCCRGSFWLQVWKPQVETQTVKHQKTRAVCRQSTCLFSALVNLMKANEKVKNMHYIALINFRLPILLKGVFLKVYKYLLFEVTVFQTICEMDLQGVYGCQLK